MSIRIMLLPAFIISMALWMTCSDPQPDPYKEEREKMVRQQISARDIQDPLVLEAMRKVERHRFVPSDQLNHAYEDRPLPIGYGQTISQPYIVAYMTEVLKPQSNFRSLEIGTGSGYQAAVLAEIVKEVYTIEIIQALGTAAEARLKKIGYTNTYVKIADGYDGWKEHAPYDIIVVTAATEYVPSPLIEQLKDGGKMVIPIGSPYMTQTLILVEKKGGKTTTKNLLPVAFVPFTRNQ